MVAAGTPSERGKKVCPLKCACRFQVSVFCSSHSRRPLAIPGYMHAASLALLTI